MATNNRFRFDKDSLEHLIDDMQKTLSGKDQKFFWDTELPCFGIKLTSSKIVYIVQRRIGKKTVRYRIGDYRVFPNVKEARKQAQRKLVDMLDGHDPNQQKKELIEEQKVKQLQGVTLRQVLNEYLHSYNLREKTKSIYRNAIEKCFPEWLDLPIIEIDEHMIAKKQQELSAYKGSRSKEGGAKAQANQAMRTLRSLFNHVIETHRDIHKRPIISINPTKTLKARRLWNVLPSREDVIAEDELADWYKAVAVLENKTIRDYLLLCLFTGLRRSEAAKLKWDSVRLSGKRPVLRIPPEDSKTGKPHELPLSDYLVALLDQRQKVRSISNRYVFPGEKPGAHLVEPKAVINKVKESSRIFFSMHTLRRTFGTIAGRLDIAYYKHKMLMNHSIKTEVTGQHYVKMTVEDLRQPMQKITDHLIELTGIDTDFRKSAEPA